MNLRKQVEPLFENRPSGFLAAEACTRGGVAIHLGQALAQANLLSHHANRRAGPIVSAEARIGGKRLIEQALELPGPGGQHGAPGFAFRPVPENLIGQVQGGQDGHAQEV